MLNNTFLCIELYMAIRFRGGHINAAIKSIDRAEIHRLAIAFTQPKIPMRQHSQSIESNGDKRIHFTRNRDRIEMLRIWSFLRGTLIVSQQQNQCLIY